MVPPPAEESGAWLVFRLGPHVLCASALDVEGITEPAAARILTIEGERFTLTVDRPVAPEPAPQAPPAAGAKPVPQTPAESQPARGVERVTHLVVRGDTLSHIALRYQGDAARDPELARLSRIRDPDLIYQTTLSRFTKVADAPDLLVISCTRAATNCIKLHQRKAMTA